MNSDRANCGTCGTVCSGGATCSLGGCVDPSSVDCGAATKTNMLCNKGDSVVDGEYWLNSNWWGVSTGVTGSQCLWTTCRTGDLVGWGTSWTNWMGPGSVKTYDSLVMGWHYGFKIANTGLPVPVSSNRAINCGWSFNVTATGTMNVSYDIWMHRSDILTNPNAAQVEEVMLWLYQVGGPGPIGGVVGRGVSLGGSTWDLHEGSAGSWRVASYVRTTNTTSATFNLMDFFHDLVSRNLISSSLYVSGIQIGTEVQNGTGELDTKGFYCRIQ